MASNLRDAARQKRIEREWARRRFARFAPYVYTGYPDWARHLQLLAEHLQLVERYVASGGREGIGRLMVFMPRRHWKSTTTSVLFPPWFLGRNPSKRVILTSYNSSLATGLSRRARNRMRGIPYRTVFGDLSSRKEAVTISDDSRSAETWDLAGHRGGLAAAGVGGGITGKGADLLIVDDPHKDRLEAESQARREAVWSWWASTARTGVEKGGAIVVIQTRWHGDDLSGRLLKAMVDDPDADRWTVICLPAVAEEWAGHVDKEDAIKALRDGWFKAPDPLGREPGEALCPEMFDLDYFRPIKANSSYDWVSLYQQRPRKVEGRLIKANKIKVVDADELPGDLRPVRYWDLAVSGSARADWVAGGLVAGDSNGNFYILDVRRIRGPWAEARPKIKGVMLEDPPEVVQGIETSGQQDGYRQEFAADEELRGRAIVGKDPRSSGDKVARAQLWATRIEDGKVYMLRGPWNETFISEALAFPQGSHDDQVDAVSGGYILLPEHVGWADIPQAPNVASRWDPFGEGRGGVGGGSWWNPFGDRPGGIDSGRGQWA